MPLICRRSNTLQYMHNSSREKLAAAAWKASATCFSNSAAFRASGVPFPTILESSSQKFLTTEQNHGLATTSPPFSIFAHERDTCICNAAGHYRTQSRPVSRRDRSTCALRLSNKPPSPRQTTPSYRDLYAPEFRKESYCVFSPHIGISLPT